MSRICRNNEIYVDIYSKSIVELGTLAHPYRSIKAAFLELLNYHSNQDKSVAIYLKENQRHYLEENNYILNITNVTITTYTDQLVVTSKAKIIPTLIPQLVHSKRTAFGLLNDTDLRLDATILEGGYTESELLQLNRTEVTLFSLRSNTYIDNIDIEREASDTSISATFLLTIYLQDKMIQMSNIDINITGVLFSTIDPFNGLFENITLDTFRLYRGFSIFSLNCNYPEASLQGEVLFNNIRSINTREDIAPFNRYLMEYTGPANVTTSN